ncbi:MAG TPA: DUF4114 domain-containing protein [Hanamia sp.]
MKTKNYLLLFIILLLVNACQKPHNGTSYQTLGTFNSSGLPNNLLKDTISPTFLSFVDSILPNGQDLRISHPEFFNNVAIGDIVITQPSDVYITFVHGVSGFTNAIAYYTYTTYQPPTSAADLKLITYAFPNAGLYTSLLPGDKVNIGKFSAGTSVGIVLMQNSWDLSTHALNNNVARFFTTDALNPETDPNLKKHAILINYAPENKLLIGFEDTDRSSTLCDNDFNDVVLYCTVTPD